MLKAKVVEEIAELPPKTHGLAKLGRLAKRLNHQISEGFLNKTEEEIKWLRSTLK